MPCYDYRDHVKYEDFEPERQRLAAANAKNDVLTDLLCQAGKAFLKRERPPQEVIQWWESHAKYDHERGVPWE